jgi:predicted RNase H-like HicB family nuclease
MADYADLSQRPPSNSSAWSPDVPDCVPAGGTLEEAERELRTAIAFQLEGLAADGETLPDPSGPGVYVERTTRTAG